MSPTPKYLLRGEGTREKSKRQEHRIAQELGGKVQKGSGSCPGHKGDVRTYELLIEAKRTDKDSLSIKKSWLKKISKEAMAYGKIPALSIEFGKMRGDEERGCFYRRGMADSIDKDWIMVPARFLRMLIDAYERMTDGHSSAGSDIR
jgi:hypothetical protein